METAPLIERHKLILKFERLIMFWVMLIKVLTKMAVRKTSWWRGNVVKKHATAEMERGIHCILKPVASFSKTHFGTTWGADGCSNQMGGTLWTDLYWPIKGCLVYKWQFQGAKTASSYLEYYVTKTSRFKDWFCMQFSFRDGRIE